MPEERDTSEDLLAAMAVELVDQMPAPRHMAPSPEIASFAGTLTLLSAEAVDHDPGYAAKVLTHNVTVSDVAGAVILVLREHGQRVGPFRRRKIQAIIGIDNNAEA